MRVLTVSIMLFLALMPALSEDSGAAIVDALNSYLNGEFRMSEETIAGVGEISDPFWQARAEIVKGLLDEVNDDLDAAEDHYRSAELIALSAPELANTATGYALVSEAKARLMLIKGVAYIIRNAHVAQKYATRSLAIDPDNITAQLVFAQGKVNAPRMFGGNVALGIEILEKVLTQVSEPSQLYTAYYALSVAWDKKRKPQQAMSMIENALELYPGSIEANARKAELINKAN